MKKWICGILLICLLISLFGCTAATGVGGVIYYEETTPPKNIDPLLAESSAERIAVQHLLEPLFRLGQGGEVIPAAASGVTPSTDGLTYTITLRQGQVWSDGQAVTAADFAFALQRALLPATKAACATQLWAIAGADAVLAGTATQESLGIATPDPSTLVITLSAADPNFITALTGVAGMPCRQDFFESCGGRYGMGKDYVIANGRFTLTRWITAEKEELLRFSKNKTYYDPKSVNPDGVVMTFASTEERLFRIEKNDVDCAVLPADLLKDAEKSELEVLSVATDTVGLVMNTAAGKPTADVRLRKALLGAIDREQLVAHFPTQGKATQSLLITGQMYGTTPYTSVGYTNAPLMGQIAGSNFSQAVDALGADAVKNLTLCYDKNADMRGAVDYIAQCFQKSFGVYVTVQPMSGWEVEQAIKNRTFDLALCQMNNEGKNSYEVLEQFGTAANSPFAGLADASYDGLLSHIKESPGGALYGQQTCEQWLYDQCVVMPLYETYGYYVYASDISNFTADPITRLPDFTKVLKS